MAPQSTPPSRMIRALPEEVRCRLRSGIAITSVAQCVEELLLNSVDAQATCIAVRVDLDVFRVQVVDNGCGLRLEDLAQLGQRYVTSKCHSLSDLEDLRFYGFRGEAIASMADVSNIVEICSRHKDGGMTFTKLIQRGEPLPVQQAEETRPSAGTTVTLYNLFHNLPVRRMRVEATLEVEKIRQRVEAASLMRPSVSISLRNDSRHSMILQLPKTRDSSSRFCQIHGLAKSRPLRELHHAHGLFKMEGFISCEGHYSKSLQFLYVNGRLVLKTRLHKAIDFIMRKESVICRAKSNPEAPPSISPGRPPRSCPDLHAVFIVDIQCPRCEYDVCYDPAKTLIEFQDWAAVVLCVEEGVRAFLKKEDLYIQPSKEDICELDQRQRCSLSVTEAARLSSKLASQTKPSSGFVGETERDCEETVCETDSEGDMDQSERDSKWSVCETERNREGFVGQSERDCEGVVGQSERDGERVVGQSERDGEGFVGQSERDSERVVGQSERDGEGVVGQSERDGKWIVSETEGDSEGQSERDSEGFVGQSERDSEMVVGQSERDGEMVVGQSERDGEGFVGQSERHSDGVVGQSERFGEMVGGQSERHSEGVVGQSERHSEGVVGQSERDGKWIVSETEGDSEGQSERHSVGVVCQSERAGEVDLLGLNVSGREKGQDKEDSMPILNPSGHGCSTGSAQNHSRVHPLIHVETEAAWRSKVTADMVPIPQPPEPVMSDLVNMATFRSASVTMGSLQGTKPLKLQLPAKLGSLDEFRRRYGKPSPLSIQHGVETERGHSVGMVQITDSVTAENVTTDPFQSPRPLKLQLPAKLGSLGEFRRRYGKTSPLSIQHGVETERGHSVGTSQITDHVASDHYVTTGDSGMVQITNNMTADGMSTGPSHGTRPLRLQLPAKLGSLDELRGQYGKPSPLSIQHGGEPERGGSGMVQITSNMTADSVTTGPSHGTRPLRLQLPAKLDSLDEFRRQYGKPSALSTQHKVEPERVNWVGTVQITDVTATESDIGSGVTSPLSLSSYISMKGNNPGATKPCSSLSTRLRRIMEDTANLTEAPSEATQVQNNAESPQSTAPSTASAEENDIMEPVREEPHISQNPPHEWLLHYDQSLGRNVFINSSTGLSTYSTPQPDRNAPCIQDLSTLAVNVLCTNGYQYQCHPFRSEALEPFLPVPTAERQPAQETAGDGSMRALCSEWKNPVFPRHPAVALDIRKDHSDTLAVKIHNILYPYRFTKDMIHSMQVLQQVDKKFIACLIDTKSDGGAEPSDEKAEPGGNLVVLVDQHAAHERVRLEQLIADSYQPITEKGGKRLKVCTVEPPLELELTEAQCRLLRIRAEAMGKIGVKLAFPNGNTPRVLVSEVPPCFMERSASERLRRRPAGLSRMVEELLQEEVLQAPGVSSGALPGTVLKVLASQACHGAVKFNDPLSVEECQHLVRCLARCSLPFQCAHGRPSIMPLADLLHLQPDDQVSMKPNLKRLRRHYNAWRLFGQPKPEVSHSQPMGAETDLYAQQLQPINSERDQSISHPSPNDLSQLQPIDLEAQSNELHLQPMGAEPCPDTTHLQPMGAEPCPDTTHLQPMGAEPCPDTTHLQPMGVEHCPDTTHLQPMGAERCPDTTHLQPMVAES